MKTKILFGLMLVTMLIISSCAPASPVEELQKDPVVPGMLEECIQKYDPDRRINNDPNLARDPVSDECDQYIKTASVKNRINQERTDAQEWYTFLWDVKYFDTEYQSCEEQGYKFSLHYTQEEIKGLSLAERFFGESTEPADGSERHIGDKEYLIKNGLDVECALNFDDPSDPSTYVKSICVDDFFNDNPTNPIPHHYRIYYNSPLGCHNIETRVGVYCDLGYNTYPIKNFDSGGAAYYPYCVPHEWDHQLYGTVFTDLYVGDPDPSHYNCYVPRTRLPNNEDSWETLTDLDFHAFFSAGDFDKEGWWYAYWQNTDDYMNKMQESKYLIFTRGIEKQIQFVSDWTESSEIYNEDILQKLNPEAKIYVIDKDEMTEQDRYNIVQNQPRDYPICCVQKANFDMYYVYLDEDNYKGQYFWVCSDAPASLTPQRVFAVDNSDSTETGGGTGGGGVETQEESREQKICSEDAEEGIPDNGPYCHECQRWRNHVDAQGTNWRCEGSEATGWQWVLYNN